MQNAPALQSNSATMSSLEIAELTGKEHRNVMRDIRAMLFELYKEEEERVLSFEHTYTNPQNAQVYAIYKLPKRDALILTSGYSIKQRAAIIDRWQELEAKQAFQIPTTLSGALRLAAEQAETIEKQQSLIEHQKPAVEFVERYVEAKSSKCLSDVAKILQRKPQEFIAELAQDGIIFKRGGTWIPYQHHIDNGRFTVHTGESQGHVYQQTRVEPEGIIFLAKHYGKDV